MRITKGTSFPTIQEAMQTMFNRETGNGPKRSYYEFKSGRAVWFPKAAIPGKDGLLAPKKGQYWLNVLSADETEIIQVNTHADCGSSKHNEYPRLTFLKHGDGPYVFQGVYTLSSRSADCRARIYTKTADAFNTEDLPGDMAADESYEPEADE